MPNPTQTPDLDSTAASDSAYPAIESFIERATKEEISELFDPLKAGLSALKGPRADQAKKVHKAIEKTEELLSHLLQVREKLEAERNDKPLARR